MAQLNEGSVVGDQNDKGSVLSAQDGVQKAAVGQDGTVEELFGRGSEWRSRSLCGCKY